MEDDDIDLFRQNLDGVRPLEADRVEPVRKKLKPIPGQRLADDRAVVRELAEASPFDDDAVTGDELLFVRPGIQHKLLRKLRRGQFSIGAHLDLHGNTVAEARRELAGFFAECKQRGIRGVRVIHGKGLRSPDGRGALKTHVDRWLRHRDDVIAFCSARPVDGGTGAVYILLKH
ncbi:MAG: Smr/MutS family protein [Pseudomonadota bacterium]